jgi:hypothetical protein
MVSFGDLKDGDAAGESVSARNTFCLYDERDRADHAGFSHDDGEGMTAVGELCDLVHGVRVAMFNEQAQRPKSRVERSDIARGRHLRDGAEALANARMGTGVHPLGFW